jgi:CheY-like chemotaxis protein
MDHMMPEMDGIEATAAIRAWEKELLLLEHPERNVSFAEGETHKLLLERQGVPIVALTANAVSGMREMFIEKGFSDFRAKPINVSKLDETLSRWIPKEKREKEKSDVKSEIKNNDSSDNASGGSNRDSPPAPRSGLSIPGVDTAKGIVMTGGTLDVYRQVLDLFRKDAENRLQLLQTTPETDALPAFVTQVHALKSASASIGAAEVSERAAELEAAGRAGNMDLIRENLNRFTGRLAELAENIREALEKETGMKNENSESASLLPIITQLLRELETALKSQNASRIDRILEELNALPLNSTTADSLGKIADDVLMAEFDRAGESIKLLLDGQKE